MGTGRTDEFRKDAVWSALSSGLSRRQVAVDLGVGMSTMNNWVTGAQLDCLTLHVNILEMNDESYRLEQSCVRKSSYTA